jgi:uncharacterized membrane protein YgcG
LWPTTAPSLPKAALSLAFPFISNFIKIAVSAPNGGREEIVKIIWNLLFLLLLLVCVHATAHSQLLQEIPESPEKAPVEKLEVPPHRNRVMDLANVLKTPEIEVLKGKTAFLEMATTTPLAILIIPDLQGEVLEEYSLRVANIWKLGRSDINNGILILVAIKDRKLHIEVGLGLESILTNEACKRIIDEDMKSFFKAGDFYGGLDSGVSAITKFLTSSQEYRDILSGTH